MAQKRYRSLDGIEANEMDDLAASVEQLTTTAEIIKKKAAKDRDTTKEQQSIEEQLTNAYEIIQEWLQRPAVRHVDEGGMVMDERARQLIRELHHLVESIERNQGATNETIEHLQKVADELTSVLQINANDFAQMVRPWKPVSDCKYRTPSIQLSIILATQQQSL